MADFATVNVGGSPMRILHTTPAGPGPHPAMVLMFHRGGFDGFTDKVADDLAAAGYVVAAPDVYHYPPVHDKAEDNAFPVDPEIIADIGATLEYLASRGDVDMRRLGIIGHCMGGRMSFLGASTHPQFKACVAYYSGNMFKPWGDENGPTPFDRLKDMKAEVAGFFGNDDQNPSPDDVAKLDAELTRLGIKHGFNQYDGAGHAFQNFLSDERFRPDQTADSWAKTVPFLDGVLKG
jgi:carboxymethylenebutenolidase